MRQKYDRIFERFATYYPDLFRQAVDWWPSDRYHVTVKLEDGMLFEFDSNDNTIRRVKTETQNKDVLDIRKDVGYNIQKIITARGMPQSEIAERSGITPAMLSRYIHGTSMPGVDKIYALASALGCRVVDILGETCEFTNT